MYNSPITVYFDNAINDLREQIDNEIFKACQKLAIDIDKEELIKLLKGDREQYTKGYSEGYLNGSGDGNLQGYKRGYDVGHDEGFYAGLCEAESMISNRVLQELEERKKNQ